VLDELEFVQALIHKGPFQAGFFQESTGVDRRFEPFYFSEPLFKTSLLTSFRVSHKQEDGPYKEEKAEKKKEGKNQQKTIFGLDQLIEH
jgi:hypothetical protein